MVDLKCNSCGSNQLHKIETEDNTYICLHCGNKQVVEENITNNRYNVTNNIVNNVYGEVKVSGDIQSGDEPSNDLQKIDALIKLGEYDRAYAALIKATNENPEMYQFWWMLTKVCMSAYKGHLTKKISYRFDYTVPAYEGFYEKSKILANEEQIKEISKEYEILNKEIQEAKAKIDQKASEASKNHIRDTIVILSVLVVFIAAVWLIATLIK
ncbi:MAG: hypothetical protein IKJ30_00230 [Bacilli bacterium]|nr:hypothetical protein [Bacilli bacterium]